MKNKLLLVLILFWGNLIYSQVPATPEKQYAFVTYHKLNTGKTIEEALEIEKIWKLVHQARKNAGLITAWEMYSVYNWNKTPDVDFDVLTVHYGSDPDKLVQYPVEMIGALLKQYPQHADLWKKTQEVYTILRGEFFVNEANVGALKPNQIMLIENIRVKPEHYFEYADMERKMANFHAERVKSGILSRWTFWQRLSPPVHQGRQYFMTTNEYPSVANMAQGGYTEELARKIFNMSLFEAWGKMVSLREVESSLLVTKLEGL